MSVRQFDLQAELEAAGNTIDSLARLIHERDWLRSVIDAGRQMYRERSAILSDLTIAAEEAGFRRGVRRAVERVEIVAGSPHISAEQAALLNDLALSLRRLTETRVAT